MSTWAQVDTFSRFSPALEVRFSYRGSDVVETLERVARQYGLPKVIRVDQASEFVSRDLDLSVYARGVTLDFSRLGKPTDNAFIESFNGKFRAEGLNAHWFMSLDDAREKCEVGVEITTRFVPTAPSAISRRYRSSTGQGMTAHPARRNGKFQLHPVQHRGAVQKPDNSNSDRSNLNRAFQKWYHPLQHTQASKSGPFGEL